MAQVGDIYLLQARLEVDQKPATLNMHYLELTPPDQELDTEALARGWDLAMRTPLVNMLCEKTEYIGVDVYRKYTDGSALGQYRVPGGPTAGAISGEQMPAHDCINVGLGQTLFDQNRNGSLSIPGIPESVADGTTVLQGHLDGVVQAFIDALIVNVTEDTPGVGVWRIGVLSQKHLTDNPGDYPGAMADVVSINAKAVIGTNRARSPQYRRRKAVPVV